MSSPPTPQQLETCIVNMSDASASVSFVATGRNLPSYSTGGYASVSGQHADWHPTIAKLAGEHLVWSGPDFAIDRDFDGTGSQRHVVMFLTQKKVVPIPVSRLHRGDTFRVDVTVQTFAKNAILGESAVSAFLRDPVRAGDMQLITTGLKAIPPLEELPGPPPPPDCASGPDPDAGVLQFSQPDFPALEWSDEATVIVERTGGSSGPVTVRLRSLDGTALAGSDYESLSTVIRFADGEMGPQRVPVKLLDDTVIEANETLDLVLSEVGGCAQLGPQSTATLTILDDDARVSGPDHFTVGGTVSGLQGSGLVLRESLGGGTVTVASNGPFTFSTSRLDRTGYDVRVDTQPTNPLQNCGIANGSGTVSGANVTNIAVTCTTPATPGSLDPSFGDSGRVVTGVAYTPNLLGARIGMALQTDGKILLVGGLKLLRLNADGAPDASFGTAGVVDVVLGGGALDTAMDVAVQADGKIVVAGTTSTFVVGSDNFALTRFNSNGSLDTTFGAGGHVTTDFFGSTDQVRRIRLQADGRSSSLASPSIRSPPLRAPPSSPSLGTTRTGRPTRRSPSTGRPPTRRAIPSASPTA